MKKFFAILLTLVLVVGAFAACDGSTEETTAAGDETTAANLTATEGVLVMATNAAFPPYEFKEGDNFAGIDVEIAGKIAEPLTQIDKITIIGNGEGNGVESVAGNVPAVMAKLFESMKEAVGIDLGEVVKAGTYDAKVNRNITINGDGAQALAQVLDAEITE